MFWLITLDVMCHINSKLIYWLPALMCVFGPISWAQIVFGQGKYKFLQNPVSKIQQQKKMFVSH